MTGVRLFGREPGESSILRRSGLRGESGVIPETASRGKEPDSVHGSQMSSIPGKHVYCLFQDNVNYLLEYLV